MISGTKLTYSSVNFQLYFMAQRSSTAAQKTHNAEATRAAILDAAEKEFANQGLVAARTETIAGASGITKTMIYYYFESKEGLYLAMLKRISTTFFHGIQTLDLAHLPPDQALEQFLWRFLTELSRNPHIPLIMLYESLQNQGKYFRQIDILFLFRTISAILERGKESGVFRSLDPEHTAVNIVGTCTYYFGVRENIKSLWSGERLLSKEMLAQHQQEVTNLILAGVKA